jgi:hypothetical protein
MCKITASCDSPFFNTGTFAKLDSLTIHSSFMHLFYSELKNSVKDREMYTLLYSIQEIS